MALPDTAVHQILDAIDKALFAPDLKRLGEWVDKIVHRNAAEYQRQDLFGFVHNGNFYRRSDVQGKLKEWVDLHPTLSLEMDAYLKDEKTIATDQALVKQCLLPIIMGCNSWQDLRDTLPDCLSDLFENTRKLPRFSAEAFTIQDNERALRQFNRIRPRIEAYAVAKLLF